MDIEAIEIALDKLDSLNGGNNPWTEKAWHAIVALKALETVVADLKVLSGANLADPTSDGRGILWGIDSGTYRPWKENSGNAKRRRRWRRRGLPNTQRKVAT